MNWSTGQLVNWSTGQLVNWSTGQLVNWSTLQILLTFFLLLQMKYFLIILLFPFFLTAQSNRLFDQDKVCSIYITIDPDTLQHVIINQINDEYFSSNFVFFDGLNRDSISNVGFRLKGNTALKNKKKSFKLSFNTFEKGRKYQGVKKLNLLANVNDPTMIRQMLYYHIYNNCGLMPRRGSFVKLFINNEYRGLYTNLEEPDDEWIEDHFESDKGNLYKCTHPADLVYKGEDENIYKNILNDPTTRAYDLKTNEEADDYSDLVDLIKLIRSPLAFDFKEKAQNELNIRSVLKSYAVDIATGNWDDYFYLKNNYYLYHEPSTGQFHYAAYDTDNSFGIDWLGIDWQQRSALKWHHQTEPRPLISSLLSVPEYNQLFINYLDSVTNDVVNPSLLFPKIDEWHALITPAAEADTYRSLDYGYSIQDFHDSYTKSIDDHSPYGLKPFIEQRRQRTRFELSGLDKKPEIDFQKIKIYPNPANNEIYVVTDYLKLQSFELAIKDLNGKVLIVLNKPDLTYSVDISSLIAGIYFLEITTSQGVVTQKLMVSR